MRRTTHRTGHLLAAAAAMIAASALAAGCFDTSDVRHPTGAPCGAQTVQDALECEGEVCLILSANQQEIPGICSETCLSNDNCSAHERCVSIDGENFCLRACNTDDDCYDATVCRLFAVGNPTRFCLADPI